MTLPSGIQKVRVYGTFINAEGKPLKGQLIFTPSVNTAGSGVTVLSSAVSVTLNAAGSFSVQLPTSDNTGLDPDGWTYQVDEFIVGHPRRYNIMLTDINETGSAALSQFAPVENVVPTGVYALLNHTHDARYYTKTEVDDIIDDLVIGGGDVTSVNGKTGVVVLSYADVGAAANSHTHSIGNITSLQTVLDGKAAAVHSHNIGDTAGLQAALDSKAATAHTHTQTDVTGLTSALAGKAASVHTHAIADTTGLQTALDGKAASVHAHAQSDVTGLASALAGKSDTTHTHDTRYYTQAQTYTKGEVDDLVAAASGGGVVASVFGRTGIITAQSGDYTKAQVGLGNVDNTSDVNKPISTATQTALNLKADASALASYQPIDSDLTVIAALTAINDDIIQRKAGGWTNRTVAQFKADLVLAKADVGLSNVDNTPDANKPVSSATQSALDLKAPLASPAFTGTVTGVTKAMVGLGSVDNTSDASKPISTATQTALDLKAPIASPTFTGTVGGITAAMVGLGNVNNTSDAAKPVSTAQQTALDLKAPLASPTFTGTVSGITKAMVGLGNVDNTSDTAKPVSTAQQTALDLKANLASPTFTGTPTLPTGTIGTTQTAGDSSTKLATTAFVTGAIGTAAGSYQPVNANLTTISGLTPSNDDVLQRKAGAWTNRTMAQLKADLALTKADVGLGSVSNALQLVAASNLSDLANVSTARTNLGLGGAALLAVGTSAGTVAAGDDSRITGALQKSTATAKGDLLVATASATIARQAVGNNTDVLVADSSQTNGIKWQNSRFEVPFAFTGTAVTVTGTLSWVNRTGRTLTIVGGVPYAGTAPTGANMILDIKKNGTSIYATTTANRPTITAGTNGGTLSGTPDTTSLADGDRISVDVLQIGSTVAGSDVSLGVVLAG